MPRKFQNIKIYEIYTDGKVIQLIEKDLQSKLQILFKKNFYDVAIKIARNQNLGKEGLVDIFRQYGDHLYEKGRGSLSSKITLKRHVPFFSLYLNSKLRWQELLLLIFNILIIPTLKKVSLPSHL